MILGVDDEFELPRPSGEYRPNAQARVSPSAARICGDPRWRVGLVCGPPENTDPTPSEGFPFRRKDLRRPSLARRVSMKGRRMSKLWN